MQLTRHTDYALRLLICLAQADGTRMAIADVAQAQDISRTHLMKIANQLAHEGFIEATRGRGGGIRLARDPAQINIGAVVQAMEPSCGLVSCAGCGLIKGCGLPSVFAQAQRAFYSQLSRHTLADVMGSGITL
jgi:Rrf2 family nitric oxide-sensitive transcriptional repressor